MEHFPAGIFNDQNGEIFGRDFKAYCFSNGQMLNFSEFPSGIKIALAEKLAQTPKAQAQLDHWGIRKEDQLERFTFCMYAQMDNIPDFIGQTNVEDPEYHNHCGLRGNCAGEGTCCSKLKVGFGILTPRELEIVILIALCYSDKAIAFELELSVETVRFHKNNIERKAGVYGKVGIASLAHKYKLI